MIDRPPVSQWGTDLCGWITNSKQLAGRICKIRGETDLDVPFDVIVLIVMLSASNIVII